MQLDKIHPQLQRYYKRIPPIPFHKRLHGELVIHQ